MKKFFALLIPPLVICLFSVSAAPAQKKKIMKKSALTSVQPQPKRSPAYEPLAIENSPELQSVLTKAVGETVNKFAPKKMQPDNLAATLIDLRDAKNPKMASFRGDAKIYPASVVKMFYLVAVHQWLKDGKLKDTPELRRAMRDMIVDSSNDATHQIVDVLTDATGGGELSPAELKIWADKREAVNRYFKSLAYADVNVTQKTYCEDIYGRERQFWNGGKNRNMLTTNATARLLAEIALGRAVSPAASGQMLELLKRDPYKEDKDADSQAAGFTGIALKDIPGARLWSKAGWTSNSRHDAAYVETPAGQRFVLVVFTEKFAGEREIIPDLAARLLRELR
ncbi:MAG: class A beta-lactamase-related serine hydrolase [Acidobacteriota bacterium]|nr:class A beta-lactamase-related serine hydrolase [Acidobacteriota bacterium]